MHLSENGSDALFCARALSLYFNRNEAKQTTNKTKYKLTLHKKQQKWLESNDIVPLNDVDELKETICYLLTGTDALGLPML